MKKVSTGEIPPNPSILNMTSNSLANKIDSVLSSIKFDDNKNTTNINNTNYNTNKTEMSLEEKKEKQKVLDDMKNDVKKFTDIFIGNSTNHVDKILKTKIFTIQIIANNPNDTQKNNKKAIEEKISIVNFTQCENILKKEYNISQNTVLIMKKLEFTPKMDIKRANNLDASQGLTFEYIDPKTMKKLNSSICSKINTPISIPFKRGNRLKMEEYEKSALINAALDLYNNESPAYYSRCVKTNQIETGADVSINYKRSQMFQNTSITCSSECEYDGLDENKYVKCNCKTSGDKESSNTGDEFVFDPLPSMNYDIVLCHRETYKDVINYYNFLIQYNSIGKLNNE
jgi:hypothetical protein